MATAESVKGKIQGLIASANAKTGNADADLTTAVEALIEGFGQGGSVGANGMENGELTITEFYKITIPVSSKKTYVVIYPKTFEDEAHNTGRISYILSVEGYAQIEIRKGGSTYMIAAQNVNTVFGDSEITFNGGHAPYNLGEYYWFAW